MLNQFIERANNLLRRKPKPQSPYAAYNERMMAMAIDLFAALIILRPVLNMLDTFFSARIRQAAEAAGMAEVLNQAQFKPPAEQFFSVMHVVFSSDVWWWVAINHGSAFLMIVLVLVLSQYSMGTTPGKWLVGLKLTRSDMQTVPSTRRVFWRYLVCIPSCALLMLGSFWIMIDKRRRAWHDIAAGTVVITTRPAGWYWGHIKRGYRWVRAKISGTPSAPNETVTKPPAE